MPIKRACIGVICGNTTTNGEYCDTCRAKREGQRYIHTKDHGNTSFYNSTEWRQLSKNILRNEPLCRACHADGIITEAKHVDHIMAIHLGGKKLEPDNLQPLCISCHSTKTMQERS